MNSPAAQPLSSDDREVLEDLRRHYGSLFRKMVLRMAVFLTAAAIGVFLRFEIGADELPLFLAGVAAIVALCGGLVFALGWMPVKRLRTDIESGQKRLQRVRLVKLQCFGSRRPNETITRAFFETPDDKFSALTRKPLFNEIQPPVEIAIEYAPDSKTVLAVRSES